MNCKLHFDSHSHSIEFDIPTGMRRLLLSGMISPVGRYCHDPK